MVLQPGADGLERRASDADRDKVANVLREQLAEGRLTLDELEQRLQLAYGARTLADLEPLTRDLPVPAETERRTPAKRSRRVPIDVRIHTSVYLIVIGFLVLIWLLTSPGGYFWPIWPALGWGVAVGVHGAVSIMAAAEIERQRRERAGRAAHTPATPARARPAEPGRPWVAVMFTDIANSTTLNEALGDDEWSRFVVRHREMIRSISTAHRGSEVVTQGDGILVRFDDPASAVRAAVDIQRRIDGMRSESAIVPRVRIGVHAGEAVEADGDLLGRTVNVASRVSAEAEAGEIIVTEPVADQVDAWADLDDRGVRTLRGIARPRHLFAVRWSDGP